MGVYHGLPIFRYTYIWGLEANIDNQTQHSQLNRTTPTNVISYKREDMIMQHAWQLKLQNGNEFN